MEFDVNKSYEFESRCIEFLREKIDSSHQLTADWLNDKKNRDAFGFILKKTAQQGFLRTHAFLVNWLGELFTSGELSVKSLQEIIALLPWRRDQVKKYLDAMVENGLLVCARDAHGKRGYQPSFRGVKKSGEPLTYQIARLKDYLKKRQKIPQEKLSELKAVTTEHSSKKKKVAEVTEQIANARKKFLPIEEEHVKELAEKIAAIYLQTNKTKEEKLIESIEEGVKENPALFFSLNYKERK